MARIISRGRNGITKKSGDGHGSLVFFFQDYFDTGVLKKMVGEIGEPDVVVADVEGTVQDIGYPFYFNPGIGMGMRPWAVDPLEKVSANTSFETNVCFCWTMNRKHIDRHLVIKLIEFFALDSYNFTWSGVDRNMDMQPVIDEWCDINHDWATDKLKSHLLSPIQHESRWIDTPGIHNNIPNNIRKDHSSSRVVDWQQVQSQVAEPSAVYLLTEGMSGTAPNYTFTERTVYSVLAGCFPIWAGNYAQAEVAEQMGMDVFHDVIDHRYQYKDSLLERCWYAIYDNLEILSDIDLARSMRQKHSLRLEKNRQWMFGGGLDAYISKQFDALTKFGIDRKCF